MYRPLIFFFSLSLKYREKFFMKYILIWYFRYEEQIYNFWDPQHGKLILNNFNCGSFRFRGDNNKLLFALQSKNLSLKRAKVAKGFWVGLVGTTRNFQNLICIFLGVSLGPCSFFRGFFKKVLVEKKNTKYRKKI